MKNVKAVIISVAVILVIGIAIFFYAGSSKFEYNEDGAKGNTNGNLYNEGLFCQYGDEVYFSNPDDNGALYKMNVDGTEFEKLSDDSSSYINVCNDYVYYKKFNNQDNKDSLLSRTLYGIVRLELGKNTTEVIHNGKIDCMTLCGNYVYYRYYDDETLFSLRKVKIDGEEDDLINKEDYAPIAVYNKEIYFTNVSDNHNIMALDTKNDKIRTVASGNFYMPDIYNGKLYFIDLGNDRKLTVMDLSTKEKKILSEDKVINYNMSGEYGVIYYQAENSTEDHKLCRINIDGTEAADVAKGNYCKINITEKYTYFYHMAGELEILYRTPTKGAPEMKKFNPKVIGD